MLKWLNYEQTASFDNKRHSNVVVLACMFQPLKQIRAQCRFLFVCLLVFLVLQHMEGLCEESYTFALCMQ